MTSAALATALLLEDQDEDVFAGSTWKLGPDGKFAKGTDRIACARVFAAYVKDSRNRGFARLDEFNTGAKTPWRCMAPKKENERIKEEAMQQTEALKNRQEMLVAKLKTAKEAMTLDELGVAIGLQGAAPDIRGQVIRALMPIRGTVVDWGRGKPVTLLNGHAKLEGKARSGHFGGKAAAKKRVGEGRDIIGELAVAAAAMPPQLPPAPQHLNGGSIVALLRSKEAELEAELALVRRMLAVA